MNPRHLTRATVLVAFLALTACGSTQGGSSGSVRAEQALDADSLFLSGMRPHHQQAVEMSDLVLTAEPPAGVAAVARQIKAAQSPEIAQMDEMMDEMTDASGRRPGGMMDGSDRAGPAGMMSGPMMADLDHATGTRAARLYLEGMVRHHRGAIAACDTELAHGRSASTLQLARTIKQDQSAELTVLQDLLRTL